MAGLIGAASGAASAGLVALITETLQSSHLSSTTLITLFTTLCAVILLTRLASQMLLCGLTVNSISRLRLGLCRRILESPLRHLEEIGEYRILASLTNDVAVISQAMNGVPTLATNVVILLCGAVYLGLLSMSLMIGAAFFCVLSMTAYWYSSQWASRYIDVAREAQDVLFKHVRELMEGIKELKTHHARREAFFDHVVEAEGVFRQRQFVGDSLYDAAVVCGRLMFLVAIGLLLFAWPRIAGVNPEVLSAYTLTIFYLISPLEQIMGWLPMMAWASTSVSAIERLGLMLDEQEAETTARNARRRLGTNRIGGRHPHLPPRGPTPRLRAWAGRSDSVPRRDPICHRRQRQRQDHLGQVARRPVRARRRRNPLGRRTHHGRQSGELPAVVLGGL